MPTATDFKDRRAIGFLTISQVLQQHKGAAQPALTAAFLALADTAIATCKQMNAQGVIVWDTSCDDVLCPEAKYTGEPRMLHPAFAPVADQFFAKFKTAGLRTGVCIRPGTLVKPTWSSGWTRVRADQYAWDLIGKMAYASGRWGCTLFYCDSNTDEQGITLGFSPLVLIRQQFPFDRFLVSMEHIHPYEFDYYGSFAGYADPNNGPMVPTIGNGAQAGAFNLVGPLDVGDMSRVAEMTALVKAGHVLMFHAWWPAPGNPIIQQAYIAAVAAPPVVAA